MKLEVRVPLAASSEQVTRLQILQASFAEVCNALGEVVQETGIWNRVVLHHLTYKQLRERFPAMGSQMVCNAIYSVSRHCRVVFQHPDSPLSVNRLKHGRLPRLHFSPNCPVYFDRHTLSIKRGQLSMYTLDGRIHFQLDLKPESEKCFRMYKLREIVLSQYAPSKFALTYYFADIPIEVGKAILADIEAVDVRDSLHEMVISNDKKHESPEMALPALPAYLRLDIRNESA